MSLLQTVSFMLPFNTCISFDNCVITWPPDMPLGKTLLLCHDLPGLYKSLAMFGCLLYHHLSCYHFTPSMIYLTLWLSCLRESCLVIMELSATWNKVPHHPRWGHLLNPWGPPLESIPSEQSATLYPVGATSWICWVVPVMSSYSRNLIIMLISHKKDNLYGEWEEVMDARMISCL